MITYMRITWILLISLQLLASRAYLAILECSELPFISTLFLFCDTEAMVTVSVSESCFKAANNRTANSLLGRCLLLFEEKTCQKNMGLIDSELELKNWLCSRRKLPFRFGFPKLKLLQYHWRPIKRLRFCRMDFGESELLWEHSYWKLIFSWFFLFKNFSLDSWKIRYRNLTRYDWRPKYPNASNMPKGLAYQNSCRNRLIWNLCAYELIVFDQTAGSRRWV